MHFCIPDTQELYSELTGTNYTAFNIYLNGAFHCCLRYKQLHAFNEELRRRTTEFINIRLPIFPPKRLLPLSNSQIEARRAALEHYLQIVGQNPRLAKSEILQTFLLNAQLETAGAKGDLDRYGGGGGYVTMDILLMNNYTVPVTGRVNDNTTTLLSKIAQCLKLPEQMVQYFCLFLAKRTLNDNLVLMRRLMDFESPFISHLYSAEPCHIVLRTNIWNPEDDLKLISNDVALNLLFLEAVADVEREWIIVTSFIRQKLRALQMHGLKKEYLELARELPLYGCLQFEASNVDYPEPQSCANEVGSGQLNTTALISIGNRELSVRTARGAKIYETKFRVTRMRCWRVTAVHCADKEAGPQPQLSFEYLMSKNVLRWITITSSQAMLMSVCLQTMVDELVNEHKGKCEKERNPDIIARYGADTQMSTSVSMPVITNNNNNTEEQLNVSSSSISSSPTAPIKFLARQRSLKNNSKILASSYAAVFYSNDSAQRNNSTMHNDAFEGINDDL